MKPKSKAVIELCAEVRTRMLSSGVELSGRYRIESVLGQGGMGAVYLASMSALGGKKVAIKEMEISQGSQSEIQQAVKQFQTEAKLLAHLDHPNLVAVTDYFSEGGKHYLVMAYVSGQNLQEKLKARGRPFSWEHIAGWAESLCEVLSYLHGQNPPILFRDLKPSNIMVDDTGRLKLIDFGIARTSSLGEKTSTFLQGTGTSGFSPIEQYGGSLSTDQSSDVYSLGATLYYLLTGQIPPDAVSRVSQEVPIEPLSKFQPDLPSALQGVLAKALAVRQKDRFQDMRVLAEEFRSVTSSASLDEEAPTEDLTNETPAARTNPLGAKQSAPAITFNMVPTRPEAPSMAPWILGFASLAVAGFMVVVFAVQPRRSSGGQEVKTGAGVAVPVNRDSPTNVATDTKLVPRQASEVNPESETVSRRPISHTPKAQPVPKSRESEPEVDRVVRTVSPQTVTPKTANSYPKAKPQSYPKAQAKAKEPTAEPVVVEQPSSVPSTRPRIPNWQPGMRGPSHPDGRPGPLVNEYGEPLPGQPVPPRRRPDQEPRRPGSDSLEGRGAPESSHTPY